ncbi:MAG: IS1 family transposase [Bacteroidetes bacterium]|nr:IS1 family transposase [Bacteroidota bacterium]
MGCPKCGGVEKVKTGFNYGRQRWKCKGCGCCYTKESLYRYPKELREQAIKMYLEGLGLRAIGRLLGVSNVSVMKWVKALGGKMAALHPTTLPTEVVVMELDELCTYLKKRANLSGYGWQLTVQPATSLAGTLVRVIPGQPGSSGIKLRG